VGIYPNPAKGPRAKILLPSHSGTEDVKIQVYTVASRKVLDRTFPGIRGGTAIEISLEDKWGTPLANGIYYVEVFTPWGKSVGKLVVLH
jgi:hypothetical protein